ncbi:MAG: adenylyltransferase/cytidyltransferase family protein [Anaerolineales bacterium]|nr:adenylyltransferase/cytidyltransferase family protein [Anaerolineales bacterium]
MSSKVIVSGCFDLLHSGHITFFETASRYGDLYVALGSDRTVFDLKGKTPVNSQEERLYMVQSVRCVHQAFISQGSGMLDFIYELLTIKPDYFVVNADGNTPEKEEICQKYGIEYIVLRRESHEGLVPRSTTALRTVNQIPFRIDLAGGWLDQPYVSKHYPGSVITISIEPTIQFNNRSGMASSTRRTAIDMWGPRIPAGDPEKLAKILFCCDNPPGTEIISGSQDSIGIVFPGLANAYYKGDYWPTKIDRIIDESHLHFIESHLFLITLGPRSAEYNVLENTNIDRRGANILADAAQYCWAAIEEKDVGKFGSAVRASFESQISMFPNMMNPSVARLIANYKDVTLGWKLSGAGGGGYLILVSDSPIENALQVTAKRVSD